MKQEYNGFTTYSDEYDELHCEWGPAMICPDGEVRYYINGILHRNDGPAIIRANGERVYSIHVCSDGDTETFFRATYSESYPGKEKYRVSIGQDDLTVEQARLKYKDNDDPYWLELVEKTIATFPFVKALVEKDLQDQKAIPKTEPAGEERQSQQEKAEPAGERQNQQEKAEPTGKGRTNRKKTNPTGEVKNE
jgi:hypothetical protein